MQEAIEVMKNVFRQLSLGEAEVPLRTPIASQSGVTLLMPAYLKASSALGVKVISIYTNNPSRGLPTITGLVNVLDAQTGQPIAILEGTYLTSLRTGAASGVATDILALKDAHVLTVFGAGTQARTQVEAVCSVRDIREIRIYSRTRRSAENFVEELAHTHHNINVIVSESPSKALRGTDIVTTATNSNTPVFNGGDLMPGVHVNAIGSFRPDMQEVDELTVQRAKVIVDKREAALSEAGDLMIPIQKGVINEQHIYAELGEIIIGTKLGRENDNDITLFKSVGNAAQDIAIAQAILQSAETNHLGKLVSL
jgi:alanine dehydrogenase